MKQMNEINQVQDDEIDLFELLQTLWDGKWLISAFVVLATLIGSGYSRILFLLVPFQSSNLHLKCELYLFDQLY